MKRLIFIFLIIAGVISAQEFTVKSVKGKVLAQKGTSEELVEVKVGDKLSGSDLILTEKNSSIRLEKEGETFLLSSDAALNVNYLKKISLNDLLLALAMEELKDLPKEESTSTNTAVYGSEERPAETFTDDFFEVIGKKKINGAKQLAEKGYKESAILMTKETFRKYPNTRKSIEDRLFLVDLLFDMKLYDECLSELKKIKTTEFDKTESDLIEGRMRKIKAILSN